MPVTLIVARARHGVIGRDNTLPWRLPEDLRHFKAATLGHAVVMGRKTFDSIGKPLAGRRNIVLTRSADWHHEGCEPAGSLQQALQLVVGAGPASQHSAEVFVAGGANVYAQALPVASRALITEIDLEVAGDAHFPDLDPNQWECVSQQQAVSSNGLRYAITEWRRRSPVADHHTPSASPSASAAPSSAASSSA